uniref:Uncharacterized protein n=1 Tax=Panagrolaimus sp. JU765 TaxID=591449 RepID=A0AC34R5X9_9BILA
MEWIRNYLQRKQDQSTVSYSRFGRPGEEEDERPPPTQIFVAPFDENAPEFKVFCGWHIERGAASLAIFGMSMVVIFFISTFFEFNWYHHQRGVDISALLGLFTYLALGVLVHYYVLYGIKKQTAYYLLPFIVVYSVVLTGEGVAFIGVMVKIFETPEPNQPSFIGILFALIVTILVQTLMLMIVLRCREYLSLKANHAMEIRIAEKGKTQNPAMEIVVAGKNSPESSTSQDQPPTQPTPHISSIENPVFGV